MSSGSYGVLDDARVSHSPLHDEVAENCISDDSAAAQRLSAPASLVHVESDATPLRAGKCCNAQLLPGPPHVKNIIGTELCER